MKESLNLKFSCNEDFSKMSISEKGLFCQACNKHVIDYTNAPESKIIAALNFKEESCGLFTAEQLDPTLRPIQITKRIRSAAFLSAIFFTVGSINLLAQSAEDPKTEQAQGASNAPNLTPQEVNEQMKAGEHISMSIGTQRPSEIVNDEVKEKKKKKYRRKKWYTSKRFPFVHRRRRFHGGKF